MKRQGLAKALKSTKPLSNCRNRAGRPQHRLNSPRSFLGNRLWLNTKGAGEALAQARQPARAGGRHAAAARRQVPVKWQPARLQHPLQQKAHTARQREVLARFQQSRRACANSACASLAHTKACSCKALESYLQTCGRAARQRTARRPAHAWDSQHKNVS